jgi:NADH-quinone oxidoreductase subunit M
MIFLPLFGVFLLLFLKNGRNDKEMRWLALAVTVLELILASAVILKFDSTTHNMQFVERVAWIPALNVYYAVGIDGLSVLMLFLAAFIGWICVLASWTQIKEKVKEFMILLLIMETAMLGVFCSMDVILFFIFWEAMLIPMYLIIGIWGGANKLYAAIKLFIYMLAGSTLMLVGIIVLYYNGGHTFDIQALAMQSYSFEFQIFIFVLFFIAFAVKVPMFPFHTWLPDAHVQAPTAGSIILAGVLLKMGAYGFMRFAMPMFPDATQFFSVPICILSIVAIIYGAFLALAQTDMKKLIAYSSVSHMGFVTLGLFLLNKNGIEGGILQMFNHGITTSALFLCVGIIYERTHTRDIARYGWAAKLVPKYAFFFFLFTIAAMGFPGTNGFIGELLILIGAYEVSPIYIIFMICGIALGAAYMLWLYKRIAFGTPVPGYGHGGVTAPGQYPAPAKGLIKDVNAREILMIAALLVFVFWVGLHPMDFLNIIHESVAHLLTQVNTSSLSSVAGVVIK